MRLLSPASYTVCQKASDKPNDKSVNCHVTGRYRETEIQWNLHGQLLTDSSTTTITNSPYTLDASTGLYHFYSTLSTKLNVTSEFKCDVKAKGLSTNISQDCKPETGNYLGFLIQRGWDLHIAHYYSTLKAN